MANSHLDAEELAEPRIKTTRPDEFTKVSSWLQNSSPHDGLCIYGISGYGGVGKTYLLSQVLKLVTPKDNHFLHIQVDGQNPDRNRNFIALYEEMAPASVLITEYTADHFTRSRNLIQRYKTIETRVEKELDKSKIAENIKSAAKILLKGGAILNKTTPKSKDYFDANALNDLGVCDVFNDAVDLLKNAKALSVASWIPPVFKNILGISYRERLRTDLFGLASTEYVKDLENIFQLSIQVSGDVNNQYSSEGGFDRLLLVIDDFEVVGKVLDKYVLNYLIPAMERASFAVVIIIIGRDDPRDAHVGFEGRIKESVRLEKFPDHVALAMFKDAGFNEEESREKLKLSKGYPFLVSFFCDRYRGLNACTRLFERTTRWMTKKEEDWFQVLVYLEKVNEETVSKMLPNENPSDVMQWFEHEASIRDTGHEDFVINPFIRELVQRYNHAKWGAKRCKELMEKGKVASEDA